MNEKVTKKVASGLGAIKRISFYKSSFSYCGTILWNSLPCDLRKAEALRQFKRLLKGDVEGTAFVKSCFFIEVFFLLY